MGRGTSSPSRKSRPRLVRLGVTGGFGSGKSTVLRMLKAKGALVWNADHAVHELLMKDPGVRRSLRRIFGGGVFDGTGQVLPQELARRAFSSPALRRRLERLLHPKVRRRMDALRSSRARVAAFEVPLLFEAGWETAFDRIAVVLAPLRVRSARLRMRHFSNPAIRQRNKAQWPLARKAARADFVIDNGTTIRQTQKQINMLWNALQRISRRIDGKPAGK